MASLAKLAVVTPWYGKHLTGGAERQARQLAEGFAGRGHDVEVLTTTSKAPSEDWGLNHFAPGLAADGAVGVRRFRVDRRDRDAFDRANAFFLSQPLTGRHQSFPPEHVAAFSRDNIRSRELLDYLRAHGTGYDAVLFLPYLYGPILEGLPIVRERAWLQPCLHHECYAFMPQVGSVFHQARGLLFNSDGEYELALRLYGPGLHGKSRVVGQWIDEPRSGQHAGQRVGQFNPSRERYALYLGRRDETKNVGLLIESFQLYRRQNYATALKLVLAGVGNTSYHDEARGIFDFGAVSDEQRDLLIDNCLALVQPSYNESFSRVVMEAWASGRPVGVNAQCVSTAQPVRRSGGGWLAATKAEWAELFRTVDEADTSLLSEIGLRGNLYYRSSATPEGVMRRYEDALGIGPERIEDQRRFVNVLASLDLANDTVRRGLTVDRWLADAGFKTAVDADPAARGPIEPDATLVLHSPRIEDFERAFEAEDVDRALVHSSEFAAVEYEVRRLAPRLRIAYAEDGAGADFLREVGAENVDLLPFAIGLQCWDVEPDPVLDAELADGKANCLFAGRFGAPSRCEELVAAFAFLLAFEVDARLIVAADLDADVEYYTMLQELVRHHRLEERVRFISSIDARALAAAYGRAAIFWSMNEGSGPLSPLVDAMWFDVPVVAFAAPATVSLLGAAGILFNRKDDPVKLAALVKIVLRDGSLRAAAIAQQEARRSAFTAEPAAGPARLRGLLGRVAVAAS